ncbi:MAG: D-glycero-alpha-D-manno-heptose-1,7-bisphosphate 7-phosphatase [Kiritimatiellia bacterium]|nr:HAD family hydrolase [Lentisphaerota bacterium]
MSHASIKCLFFDRDGVVNEDPGEGYVLHWEDLHVIPSFLDCLRLAQRHDYRAAIVTNQRCVARGILSIEQLEDMHHRLGILIRRHGIPPLLDIIYCPHHPHECDCRKPLPGMITQLARRHGINLSYSWMIGDRETDVLAGRAAGCRTILVQQPASSSLADHIVPDMPSLPALLERLLEDTAAAQ